MPRIRPPARCAWALHAVALLAPSLSAAQSVANQRIVDIIADLQRQGHTIIYNSELVGAELRVQREVSASDPLERLRQVLVPYGLALEAGPRGSWLVVRSDPAAAPQAPASGAMPPTVIVAPPSLEEVVVSASRYSISRDPSTSTSLIDRVQLDNTPTLGEDALRVTHSLPGLTSSGLTAQFNVRGGTTNEGLLFLDGVQLLNPFHLKDFQSLFSGINPSIVDSMTVYTGAFPAQFGDRMSSVIEMTSIEPRGPAQIELGASLLTTSLLAGGRFGNGRGAWLANLRRGNLDLLIDAANSDLGDPEYVDVFGKLSYDLSSSWTLSLGMLMLDDEIALQDSDLATASAAYDDSYVWARADHAGERLSATVLLSTADLTGDRSGSIDDPVTSTGSLVDDRAFQSTTLKGDWTYRFNDRHLLSWGAELQSSRADYRYAADVSASLPIVIPAPLSPADPNFAATTTADGRHSAVYLSYRARPLTALTTELGLRVDEQSHLDDRQVSPRFNLLLDITERTRLRASWGRYFQTQRLDELKISDGITAFAPAQESEHYVLGIEHVLDDGTSVRLEAYRKEIERLDSRNENLFARVSLLPELLPDRVVIAPLGGESTGLELSADGEHGRWRWWASLVRARSYDLLADTRAARSWEEPWSLKGGAIRMGGTWNLALTTTWHSGWPISTLALVDGELTASAYNAGRFGEFGSVDLKLSRNVELERSELEWYVSLTNVFARENPCCIDYDVGFDASGGPASLTLSTDNWLSIVPNVGVLWRFARRDP